MNNSTIIGIDLSFNSTGITITQFQNNKISKISFYRLVFDDESLVNQKKLPYIKNVNQYLYKLPTNIDINDIVFSGESDFYSKEQSKITLKAMICCKRLIDIINRKIFPNRDLYVNIEGFIMPSISGVNQFQSLSGLIMLQGLLRSELIKIKLHHKIDNFKLFITSPSDLKKWFTGDGGADKQKMLDSFNSIYDGKKILPETLKLNHVNDVIDSFALNLNCIAKIYDLVEYKPKKIKKKKIKVKLPDILKTSINL